MPDKDDFNFSNLPPDVVQEIAHKAINRAFVKEGFLSKISTVLIKDVMKDEVSWFALAMRLNEFAQKIWSETRLEGAHDDPKMIAVRLLAKSNRAFQAAVLLAQRGMCAESETMSRTCLETTFWLGYLLNEPDEAVQALFSDEWKHGGERAEMFASMMDEEQAAPFHEAAKVYAAKYATNKTAIGPKILAKRAGMADIYPYYKALCGISAHPSIASLDRIIAENEDGSLGLRLGPDYEQVMFSLLTAINTHLWGVEKYAVIQGWPEDDITIQDLRKERDALMMTSAG